MASLKKRTAPLLPSLRWDAPEDPHDRQAAEDRVHPAEITYKRLVCIRFRPANSMMNMYAGQLHLFFLQQKRPAQLNHSLRKSRPEHAAGSAHLRGNLLESDMHHQSAGRIGAAHLWQVLRSAYAGSLICPNVNVPDSGRYFSATASQLGSA